jgi:hypothetical protein
MPPDHTTHLITAARQRHELTRAKAIRAIRQLARTGTPITFGSVARTATVSSLYLALMGLDPTGRGRGRWVIRWKAALNAFDITFDGQWARNGPSQE